MTDYKIDTEEKELLNSIESGEWKSIDNLEDEIKKSQEIAKNTLKENNIDFSKYKIDSFKNIKDPVAWQNCLRNLNSE